MTKLTLSTFRVDVTPPLGFPLGGFRKVPAVQSVRQHDAPWPDRDAQQLVAPPDELDDIMDVARCDSAARLAAEGGWSDQWTSAKT